MRVFSIYIININIRIGIYAHAVERKGFRFFFIFLIQLNSTRSRFEGLQKAKKNQRFVNNVR